VILKKRVFSSFNDIILKPNFNLTKNLDPRIKSENDGVRVIRKYPYFLIGLGLSERISRTIGISAIKYFSQTW
jgi:hypothetical protein